MRALGIAGGRVEHVEHRVVRRELEIPRQQDPDLDGVGERSRRRERVCRLGANGRGAFATAEQPVHPREVPLRLRRAQRVGRAHLARNALPEPERIPQFARTFGAAGETVGDVEPRRVAAFGPELERSAKRGARVAVRMDGARRICGGNERGARALAIAGAEPVLRDEPRRRPPALQRLRDPTMQLSPPWPGHVCVHRLADERVTERHDTAQLADEPMRRGVAEVRAAVDLRQQRGIDPLPRHGGDLERRASVGRQLIDEEQDRVADGLGQRNLASRRERKAVVRRHEHLLRRQSGDKLLDEERHSLRPVVDRRRERRRDRLADDARRELRRSCARERWTLDLVETFRTP